MVRSRRILVVLAASVLWPLSATAGPIAKPLAGKVILLDPGHAVKNEADSIINPGARGRHHGIWERDVALNVAAKVVPLLEAQGAKVYMTRTIENPWRYAKTKSGDNRARAILANVLGVQAYVRIHVDWNRSRSFNGFTTYYYRWESRGLAKSIRDAFVQRLPTHRDNGMHRRSFVSVTSKMPSVLMELGVLSNRSEVKDLASDAYQSVLAQAIADGIVNYFSKS